MLERIIYVSRAAPGIDSEAVHAIIREAHARNATAALTGALVFLDGWFVQLIEGPAAAARRVYAAILHDPRHQAVVLRARDRAFCRLFPGQVMALRTCACLDPALLDAFGYRPGFPVADFPADVLAEFLVRACRMAAAKAPRPSRRRTAS